MVLITLLGEGGPFRWILSWAQQKAVGGPVLNRTIFCSQNLCANNTSRNTCECFYSSQLVLKPHRHKMFIFQMLRLQQCLVLTSKGVFKRGVPGLAKILFWLSPFSSFHNNHNNNRSSCGCGCGCDGLSNLSVRLWKCGPCLAECCGWLGAIRAAKKTAIDRLVVRVVRSLAQSLTRLLCSWTTAITATCEYLQAALEKKE